MDLDLVFVNGRSQEMRNRELAAVCSVHAALEVRWE